MHIPNKPKFQVGNNQCNANKHIQLQLKFKQQFMNHKNHKIVRDEDRKKKVMEKKEKRKKKKLQKVNGEEEGRKGKMALKCGKREKKVGEGMREGKRKKKQKKQQNVTHVKNISYSNTQHFYKQH